MAYTGILLRGDTHANIIADPPIHREAAITDKAVIVGYDSGSGVVLFPLNYALLSKIGAVADDGTVALNGIKTSDLAIVFDGTGDLNITDSNFTIKDTHILSTSLEFIKSMTSTTMTITDLGDPETTQDIVFADIIRVSAITQGMIDNLTAISNVPVLATPSTTTVDITNVQGTVEVVDENESSLGTLTADGTLTFSTTQTSGARIYAYNYDVSKNKSKRVSILIP